MKAYVTVFGDHISPTNTSKFIMKPNRRNLKNIHDFKTFSARFYPCSHVFKTVLTM